VSFGSPLAIDEVFSSLCGVPSPSGDEAAVAAVVAGLLSDLGVEVREDQAGAEFGGDQGNLAATFESSDGRSTGGVVLAAHLDTVPPTGAPSAVLEGGTWRNGGAGILGVDNKAAVAALICGAARWAQSAPPVPVHVVFTVAEEIGLKGAAAFDIHPLGAEACFVFDHPTPIGTVVGRSPSLTRYRARITGRAAHAGVSPEAGASALIAAAMAVGGLPQGRVSETAVGNVGRVEGGGATNVVAAECLIEGELRGFDADEHSALLLAIGDSLQDAAAAVGCSADLELSRAFDGYDHPPGHRAVEIAGSALRSLGVEPELISSAGGSDANVFEAVGVPTVNLGDGSRDTHTPEERIADADLRTLEMLVAALPEAAAG